MSSANAAAGLVPRAPVLAHAPVHPTHAPERGASQSPLLLTPRLRRRERELRGYQALLRQEPHARHALLGLGRVWLASAEPHRALAAFLEALKLAPEGAEERLGVCEARIECGEFQAALDELAPLYGERPDAWVLAAAAAEAAGALQDLPVLLKTARSKLDSGFIGQHRQESYAVLIGLHNLYTGSTELEADVAGLLPALALRAPLLGDLEPRPEWAQRVFRCVRNLALSGQVERIEPFLEPRVEAFIPDAGRAAREALAEMGAGVVEDEEPSRNIVLVSTAADQAFVASVLAAHPDLHVYLWRANVAGDVREQLKLEGAECSRQVWVARAGGSSELVLGLPKARRLSLGRPGDLSAMLESKVGRTLSVGYQRLLSHPVESLAQILAFLGEAPHGAPLRKLIEAYPGGTNLEVLV